MSLKFKVFSSVFVLFATISFSAVAAAQTRTSSYETPGDVFNRAYFNNDRDFYNNQSYQREINLIFGPGSLLRNSFPENEIARDAELVNAVYHDALYQQVSSDPYIRTPDLPNPYNSSLITSPRLNGSQLRVGTEFRFEPSR